MLARRTAAEIRARQQDRSAREARLIQFKFRVDRTVRIEAPVVKQELPEAAAFDALEELLGDDLICIDVDAIQRRYQSGVSLEGFHMGFPIFSKMLSVA